MTPVIRLTPVILGSMLVALLSACPPAPGDRADAAVSEVVNPRDTASAAPRLDARPEAVSTRDASSGAPQVDAGPEAASMRDASSGARRNDAGPEAISVRDAGPEAVVTADAGGEVDYFSCAQDSDCVLARGEPCGCTAGGSAASVRRQSVDAWNARFPSTVACPAVLSTHPSCFSDPVCKSGRCGLRSRFR